MFKTFRVAGLAAAIATLCLHAPAAAAQNAPAAPVAPAASIVPAANAAPEALASALTPLASVDLNIQNLSTNQAPATTNVQTVNLVEPARATAAFPAPVRMNAAPAVQPALIVSGTPARRSLDDLVAEHAAAETTDAQFECLASAVYFESRGEPLEGQLAVAEVILNRVASGRFRSTICEVVTQPSQFSFVRRGQIPEAPRSSAAWQRAVAIAHIALQNLHDVTGDDSLFFHATYVRPSWGRSTARIARIGRHIFYR